MDDPTNPPEYEKEIPRAPHDPGARAATGARGSSRLVARATVPAGGRRSRARSGTPRRLGAAFTHPARSPLPSEPVTDRPAHHELQVVAHQPGQLFGEQRHAPRAPLPDSSTAHSGS